MSKRFISLVCGVILILFSAATFMLPAHAAPRDCDSNAIIRCGTYSKAELNDRTKGDVAGIFAHYGIHKAHFPSLVDGAVHRDGRITVGSRVVATNAISTGRHHMPGSTAVNAGGKRIYERPTSVSFRSANIPAYVKMTNGKFQYAIIKSCGNPTKGRPVPEPPKPPAPVPPKPQPPKPQPPKPQPPKPPKPPKPTNPGIEIEKTVNKAVVEVGEEFDYTVQVRNTGDVDLVNAQVSDPAPANIEFVPDSGTAGTTVTSTQFSATIPSLQRGEVRTYTFKAKFTQYVKNIVDNEACVVVKEPKELEDCDTAGNQPKKPVEPPAPQPQPQPEPEPITPVTYTKELPQTGPAEVVGSAMGISSATYGAVSYLRSRRSLKDLFRK